MSEWTSTKELLPLDGVECEVLFEDGTKCLGLYLGNDPVAPLDGWMLDVTDQLSDSRPPGEIVKWRKFER